jgi:hypothetical protein
VTDSFIPLTIQSTLVDPKLFFSDPVSDPTLNIHSSKHTVLVVFKENIFLMS